MTYHSSISLYRIHEEDSAEQREIKAMCEGFIGWFGMGGSVFQWNPELELSFAFTPNLLHWFDTQNIRSLRYLNEVVKCVKACETAAKLLD